MEQQIHAIKPFGVRMPDEMKDWLTARARKAKRAMNSEMLLLLEEAMQAEQMKGAA